MGSARAQLAVSKRLEQLPAVADAVRNGELSQTQAELVADGATANPDATERLVALAKRSSLPELRDAVRRARAAADGDPDATEARIQAAAPTPHVARRRRGLEPHGARHGR